MTDQVYPVVTVLSDGSVFVEFPYDAAMVAALKSIIPSGHRSWDPANKVWVVTPQWATRAVQIAIAHFPDVEIVHEKPERAEHLAALHLLPTAPQSVIRAVHRCLVKEFHPDLYPQDQKAIAHARMATINAAVQALTDDAIAGGDS